MLCLAASWFQVVKKVNFEIRKTALLLWRHLELKLQDGLESHELFQSCFMLRTMITMRNMQGVIHGHSDKNGDTYGFYRTKSIVKYRAK